MFQQLILFQPLRLRVLQFRGRKTYTLSRRSRNFPGSMGAYTPGPCPRIHFHPSPLHTKLTRANHSKDNASFMESRVFDRRKNYIDCSRWFTIFLCSLCRSWLVALVKTRKNESTLSVCDEHNQETSSKQMTRVVQYANVPAISVVLQLQPKSAF